MANRKLSDLQELLVIDNDDIFYVVDTSDTTESPEGTSKFIKKENITPASSNGNFTVTDYYVTVPGTQNFVIPTGEQAFLVINTGTIQFKETVNNASEFNLYTQVGSTVILKDTTQINNYIYILSR